MIYSVIRYSLIAILLLAICLLWNENKKLQETHIELLTQLDIVNQTNQDLKDEITKINKQISKQIEPLTRSKQTQNSITKEAELPPMDQKKIMIVLPPDEKNYPKIIQKIDFKDIDLKLDETSKNKNTKEEIKVNPEVYIDKETKKFDGARITIETKF
jgi:hypothetical protein